MKPARDLSGRSVLVTGAGGFIGSHLAERLVALGARTKVLIRYNSSNARGWPERSPAKDSVEVILGDVRDRDTIRDALRGADTGDPATAAIITPIPTLIGSSRQFADALKPVI